LSIYFVQLRIATASATRIQVLQHGLQKRAPLSSSSTTSTRFP